MKKVVYLFLVVLILFMNCKSPTEPEDPTGPTYFEVQGTYERVYGIVQTLDQRLPYVVIREVPDYYAIEIETEEVVRGDEYSFADKRLTANYPNGVAYELYVVHLLVQTDDRISVGRKITLNGTEMLNPIRRGEYELVRFRIDTNGNVHEVN